MYYIFKPCKVDATKSLVLNQLRSVFGWSIKMFYHGWTVNHTCENVRAPTTDSPVVISPVQFSPQSFFGPVDWTFKHYSQVTNSKCWISEPSCIVETSRVQMDDSVCRCSLVNLCHVASSNSSSCMILLCRGGKRPSKTAIVHWISPVSISSIVVFNTYLKKVFKISCCHFFHCWNIIVELLNGPMSKHWDISVSIVSVRINDWEKWESNVILLIQIWMPSLPTAYNKQMRCVNTAFQTPNSNLWRRSGVNNEWNSNPCGPRCSKNAFWNNISCSLQKDEDHWPYLSRCQRLRTQ
jgi:hypothetical protein